MSEARLLDKKVYEKMLKVNLGKIMYSTKVVNEESRIDKCIGIVEDIDVYGNFTIYNKFTKETIIRNIVELNKECIAEKHILREKYI